MHVYEYKWSHKMHCTSYNWKHDRIDSQSGKIHTNWKRNSRGIPPSVSVHFSWLAIYANVSIQNVSHCSISRDSSKSGKCTPTMTWNPEGIPSPCRQNCFDSLFGQKKKDEHDIPRIANEERFTLPHDGTSRRFHHQVVRNTLNFLFINACLWI